MNINKAEETLNNLYMTILGRPVDDSGRKSYIEHMHTIRGVKSVRQALIESIEFKQKNNIINNNHSSFNSLTGDRVAYISSADTSTIDNSRYGKLINYLVNHILLLDYNYNTENIAKRINTVKKSLIHIGRSNLRFTILPHKEYDFNTEKFLDSLKDINNLKYYIYYMCIANAWKDIFGKTVATCQTKVFLNNLNDLFEKEKITFKDIINVAGNYIIDYISVRVGGLKIDDADRLRCISYLQSENATAFINHILSIFDKDKQKENEIIEKNISNLIKDLGRKPKVLIMIAYLETQNDYFLEKMMYHIHRVKNTNTNLDIDFALDNDRIDKEPSDYTPWSRVKRIRNLMINKYAIEKYDYLYIIDSDMIDYPHDFLSRAIGLNPNGITAPIALIQNSITFYDWCGYQKKGATSLNSPYRNNILQLSVPHRNFALLPPYVDDKSRLVEIDCVGCTYVVPAKVFSQTYGDLQNELIEVFKIANVTNHKIKENIVQYEDHPSFTDHYTICAAVRANGGKIYMDRGSAAYHADLPLFGENWH